MAEVKDKVVTVESLAALNNHNKENYMTKVNPTGAGVLSINRESDTTIGDYSVAVGFNTEASATASFAEGTYTTAKGAHTHAEGNHTIATGDSQHVQGKFNIEDTSHKYAHIVGNGDSINRSNAHTLDWQGNAWFAGNISADGNIVLTSNQYGDALPAAGTVGRIFFKKLSE